MCALVKKYVQGRCTVFTGSVFSWIYIGLALLDPEPDPLAMKLRQMTNKPDP
jgi:hypothetical protein